MPLVLAGPILRRVEPRSVSVWLALSAPCEVELRVWNGAQSGSTSAPSIGEPGRTSSLRIGTKLHLVLVTKDLPEPDAPLFPDQLYSYDLEISPGSGGPAENLKALSLLKDGFVNGRPHLALGYGGDQLPTFALPPQRLDNLRLFQGSCRRTHSQDSDALAFLDGLIAEKRGTPDEATHRPHQLFLTGDQIYADEVATPLLPAITDVGVALIGGHGADGPDGAPIAIERLPVKGVDYPVDRYHFPSGRRKDLMRFEAKFSTTGGHAHLMSLGEYGAMYLFAWSNVLWPDSFPTAQELFDNSASPLDAPGIATVLSPPEDATKESVRDHYGTEAYRASQTRHLFDIEVSGDAASQQLIARKRGQVQLSEKLVKPPNMRLQATQCHDAAFVLNFKLSAARHWDA